MPPMVGQDEWEEGRDEKKGRMMEVLFVGAVTDVSERSDAVQVERRCLCRLCLSMCSSTRRGELYVCRVTL